MWKTAVIITLALAISANFAFGVGENLKVEVIKIQNGEAESLYPAVVHLNSNVGKTTVHSASNSLIVVDHPENVERIRRVIEQLDVRRKQVAISVLVAEVAASFMGEIGLGIGEEIIPAERFHEVQYLVQSSKFSDIRSRMTVRTISGQPATLQVATRMVVGGTVTRKGGVVTVVPQTERAAGEFLEVIPKVNNNGTISVILRPEKSEFLDDGSIRARAILTRVMVRDGDTIVLGGIDTADWRFERKGLPETGMSVPVRESAEEKLMVMFLTVTIVD